MLFHGRLRPVRAGYGTHDPNREPAFEIAHRERTTIEALPQTKNPKAQAHLYPERSKHRATGHGYLDAEKNEEPLRPRWRRPEERGGAEDRGGYIFRQEDTGSGSSRGEVRKTVKCKSKTRRAGGRRGGGREKNRRSWPDGGGRGRRRGRPVAEEGKRRRC